MAPEARLDGGTVHLGFDDPEAVKAFFEAARREDGFLLVLPEPLKQFTTQPFSVDRPAGVDFAFEATVIQVFPAASGARVAFQLAGWSEAKELELARKLRGVAAGAVSAPEPGPGAGASPIHHIKELNVSQRMRLAMKAGRTERQILLRDTSPQVLLGLLANPRIESKEVLEVVKSNFATGAIMKRVTANRSWAQNLEIRSAVVRSPKTPTPLALRLIDTLSTPDLGALGKSGAAREEIRKAALRLYLKRISSRGL